MTDFEYMNKYGDDGYQLDGMKLQEEQKKIDEEECKNATKKCIEKIRELISADNFDKTAIINEAEELIGFLEEI